MRKKIVLLALAAVTLLSATYVHAQGYGMGPGMGPRMGPGHRGSCESWGPAKEYPLTPDQKAKFQELRRKFRDENAKQIGAMVSKRLEFQSLWTDPKADPKAILEKEKELRDLKNQLRDKGVHLRLEARKFLTPEQIENWGPGWGMGRGGMGHGFGRGCMMGGGYGMGRGEMGPGYGCY